MNKDSAQCLASWEIHNNIPQFLIDTVSLNHYKLTEKIRTNKEIAAFIKNLFDLSNRNETQNYSNITVHYFTSVVGVWSYIEILKNKDWKIINYTPSQYKNTPMKNFKTDLMKLCIKSSDKNLIM